MDMQVKSVPPMNSSVNPKGGSVRQGVWGCEKQCKNRLGCHGQYKERVMTNNDENNDKGTNGTGAWIGVGLALGVAIGAALDNIGLGLVLGVVAGAVIGAARTRKEE
jgi:hypothetical protein